MLESKNKILLTKAYLISALLFLFAVGVFVRMLYVQNYDVEKYKNMAQQVNFRNVEVSPLRGNIYSSDSVLLKTTVTKYDIYMDLATVKDKLFNDNIKSLSDSLDRLFSKPKGYFLVKLVNARKDKNRYYLIKRDLDYNYFSRIKKFPIFEKGQSKGGLIVEREDSRIKVIDGFGDRLLGFDYGQNDKVGIEGAFFKYLRGIPGREVQQRINKKEWKPINVIREPQNGDDIYTTINMKIQDIAYSTLKSQLEKSEANHGCVVVMEVKTGRILAMVNLSVDRQGKTYRDNLNYAISQRTEPGSLFKTVSSLALLDDGYLTPNSTVNTGEGYWKFKNQVVRDTHTHGIISLSKVLEQSSNVGISKFIYTYYSKNPQDYLNKLISWGLAEKSGINMPGEATPILFKNVKSMDAYSLVWMSFGYSVEFTPLQILNFYNGIANNGVMLYPQILEKVVRGGNEIFSFKPKPITGKKMASDKAIDYIKGMLVGVVERGTSKSIFTPNMPIAGKTGTIQLNYNISKGSDYQASFCGFFPANNPEYSCIVVINKPKQGFYYGQQASAPVFKEIAGKIYMKKPIDIELQKKINDNIYKEIATNRIIENFNNSKVVPNVVGKYGMDVIPELENLGLKIEYDGLGKIKQQSIVGYPIKKGMKIYLKMER